MTKRALKEISVLLLLLLFGYGSGANASSVLLVPTSGTSLLTDGSVVSFDVMIDFSDAGGTLGGGLDIAYDATALGLVSVTGTSLGDPGFSRNPDAMSGLLQSWAVGDFDGLGSTGPQLLGRVQFEVLPAMGANTSVTGSATDGIAGPWISGQDFVTILTPNYNQIKLQRGESSLLNATFNDAWYEPATQGQGFFITVFPDIGYVSLSWFTYDTERPKEGVTANLGEAGHRWLNALGTYSGNQAVLDVNYASGGLFDTATEITEISDGTIILTFTDCENGMIEYDIPSIDQQGVVPIQRVVGDNIARCKDQQQQAAIQYSDAGQKTGSTRVLSFDPPVTEAEPAPLVEMNVGLNDAWFYPDTSGQGFFITVFPDIAYVLLSWFTYDTERPEAGVTANLGEPGHRWLNALGPYTGNQAMMDITIASGGIFDTPTEIAEVNDGTIILTFPDCENGTVDYDIPSIDRKGLVPIQRVVGDNIALCEALNSQ